MDVDAAPRSRSPTPPPRSRSPRKRSGSRPASPGRERSASPSKPKPSAREDAPSEQPAKRARTRVDDAGRGRRMFGNILGTLRKFNDESRESRTSAAAKRREETSARIAAKLRSEADAQRDLVESERELRSLRVATENAAYVLDHREIAMGARHKSLRAAARYLNTKADPLPTPDTALFPSSPAPTAQRRAVPAALYFLPKVLLPHQENALRAREDDIARTIADEAEALERDRAAAQTTARDNADRIADLEEKVRRLRQTSGTGTGPKPDRRPSAKEDARTTDIPASRERLRSRSRSRSRRSPEPRAPQRADDEMEVEY